MTSICAISTNSSIDRSFLINSSLVLARSAGIIIIVCKWIPDQVRDDGVCKWIPDQVRDDSKNALLFLHGIVFDLFDFVDATLVAFDPAKSCVEPREY